MIGRREFITLSAVRLQLGRSRQGPSSHQRKRANNKPQASRRLGSLMPWGGP